MCTYSPFMESEIITIDVHGMTEPIAKEFIYATIENASQNIREIIVIHGYNRGIRLQHLVRHELKPKRKVQIIISENPGMTYLDFIN